MVSRGLAKYLEPLLFPVKLYNLAHCEEVKSVNWCSDGSAVEIHTDALSRECFCPEIFNVADHKHVFRQLSYYGFKRVERTGNVWIFYHPNFIANRLDLVSTIRRAGKKNKNFIKAVEVKPDFLYIERRTSSRLKSKDNCNYFLDDVKEEKDESLVDSPDVNYFPSKSNNPRGRKRKQIDDEEYTNKSLGRKTKNLTPNNLSTTSGKDLNLLKTTLNNTEPSPPIKRESQRKPRRQKSRKRRARNSKKSVSESARDPPNDATLEVKRENRESDRTFQNDFDDNNNKFRSHGNNDAFYSTAVKTEPVSESIDTPVDISNSAIKFNTLDCDITYVSETLNRELVPDITRDDNSFGNVVMSLNNQNDHNYSVVQCDRLGDSSEPTRESMPRDQNSVNNTQSKEIKKEILSECLQNGAEFVLGSNYSWKPYKNQIESDTSKVSEDTRTTKVPEKQLSNKNPNKADKGSAQKSSVQPYHCSINDVFRTSVKVEPEDSSQTVTAKNPSSTKDLPEFQNLCKPAKATVASSNLSNDCLNKNTDDEPKPPINTEDTLNCRPDIVKLETNVKKCSTNHKENRLSKNHNFNDILISDNNSFIGGYCLRDRNKVKIEGEKVNQCQFDRNLEEKRPRRSKSAQNQFKSHARELKRSTIPTPNHFDQTPLFQSHFNGTYQFIQPNPIGIGNPGTILETSKKVMKRSTEKEAWQIREECCSPFSNTVTNCGSFTRPQMPKETCQLSKVSYPVTVPVDYNDMRRHTPKETYKANSDKLSNTKIHTADYGKNRHTPKGTYRANGDIGSYTNHTAENIDKTLVTMETQKDPNLLTLLTFEEVLCSCHLPKGDIIENQEPTGDVSCLTLLDPKNLKQEDDVYIHPTKRKQLIKFISDKFKSGELCSWDVFESPNPYIRSCAYDAFTLDFESL